LFLKVPLIKSHGTKEYYACRAKKFNCRIQAVRPFANLAALRDKDLIPQSRKGRKEEIASRQGVAYI
jgi:hypothetical protein